MALKREQKNEVTGEVLTKGDRPLFDSKAPLPGGNHGTGIDGMSTSDLLALRAEIEARLPPLTLKGMDLEKELAVQYQVALALQTEVLGGNEEANKKAQVLNTTSSALQNIVKLQAELHTAERLKDIETHLIKSLEKLPVEMLTEFFDWYSKSTN